MKPLSTRFEEDQIKGLRDCALQRGLKEGKNVPVSAVIRMAVDELLRKENVK